MAGKRRETETQRRTRHALAFAKVAYPDMTGKDLRWLAKNSEPEFLVRTATYAALVGRQKRTAADVIAIRERVFRDALKAFKARAKRAAVQWEERRDKQDIRRMREIMTRLAKRGIVVR